MDTGVSMQGPGISSKNRTSAPEDLFCAGLKVVFENNSVPNQKPWTHPEVILARRWKKLG